jgi:hypothetical protein
MRTAEMLRGSRGSMEVEGTDNRVDQVKVGTLMLRCLVNSHVHFAVLAKAIR